MDRWILGEKTDEVCELFALMDKSKNTYECKVPRKHSYENICEKCKSTSFCVTPDYEDDYVTCTKCGNVQGGYISPNIITICREHGKTVYDPCERFKYWIDLAQGITKNFPKELQKKIHDFKNNTELKEFLMFKKNRKYRKFYGVIMRMWDENLVEPLSNTEIESLIVNFMHLQSYHSRNRSKNPKTGRKKSLPHYIFLITTFLNKIGREDLASNFLPMKCVKIKKEYEEIINHLFS